MTANLVSEMYTAAGLKESTFLAHTGSSAGSAAMLYMTPQKYRQTRSRNGISWLMSCAPAPTLAMNSAAPMLNVACSSSVGSSSSQYQVSGSPVPSTMANSTTMDSSVKANMKTPMTR